MKPNIQRTRRSTFMWLTCLVALCAYTPTVAQHISIVGATLTIGAGTSLTTSGNVTIGDAGTIQNHGALNLEGNWTNNGLGLSDNGPGSVRFNGTVQQTIGGSSVTAFSNVMIDNVRGVLLENNASISQILTFMNGVLSTGGYDLVFTQPCLYPQAGATKDRFISSGSTGATVLRFDESCSTSTVDLGEPYLPLTYTAKGLIGGAVDVRFATGSGRSPIGMTLPSGDGIGPLNRMNQYISIQHEGVGTLTSYSLAFDMQSTIHSGNAANYVVRRYNSTNGWTTIPSTVVGTMITTAAIPALTNPQPSLNTDLFLVGEFDAALNVSDDKKLADNNYEAYPNPTSSQLTVRFLMERVQAYEIKVYDLSGRVVVAREGTSAVGTNIEMFEMGSLSKGVYVLRIETRGTTPQTLRIAVQ